MSCRLEIRPIVQLPDGVPARAGTAAPSAMSWYLPYAGLLMAAALAISADVLPVKHLLDALALRPEPAAATPPRSEPGGAPEPIDPGTHDATEGVVMAGRSLDQRRKSQASRPAARPITVQGEAGLALGSPRQIAAADPPEIAHPSLDPPAAAAAPGRGRTTKKAAQPAAPSDSVAEPATERTAKTAGRPTGQRTERPAAGRTKSAGSPPVGSCEAVIAAYREEIALGGSGPADITASQYGAVLNQGGYFSHCGVPSSMAVTICAAVRQGHAQGVTVRTDPPSSTVRRCVAAAVQGLSFPSHHRLDVTTTTFAARR